MSDYQYYRPHPKNITKGVWRISDNCDGSEYEIHQSTDKCFRGHTLATVRSWETFKDKNELSANAHAIASVPDMVEALTMVMDCIRNNVQLSDMDKLMIRNVHHKLRDETMEKVDE